MKITLDGQYQTRSGLKVRIYATDCGADLSVHGAVLVGSVWSMSQWYANGRANILYEANSDLIPIPRTIKIKRWVNVYDDGASFHVSTEDAQHYARKGALVIAHPIEFEVTLEAK
jgi:hypothetical protein